MLLEGKYSLLPMFQDPKPDGLAWFKEGAEVAGRDSEERKDGLEADGRSVERRGVRDGRRGVWGALRGVCGARRGVGGVRMGVCGGARRLRDPGRQVPM